MGIHSCSHFHIPFLSSIPLNNSKQCTLNNVTYICANPRSFHSTAICHCHCCNRTKTNNKYRYRERYKHNNHSHSFASRVPSRALFSFFFRMHMHCNRDHIIAISSAAFSSSSPFWSLVSGLWPLLFALLSFLIVAAVSFNPHLFHLMSILPLLGSAFPLLLYHMVRSASSQRGDRQPPVCSEQFYTRYNQQHMLQCP